MSVIDTYIGWDIGGAHLKVASIDHLGAVNFASQVATPMWEGFASLKKAVSEMRDQLEDDSVMHTITMTAELVDIFKDRDTGVKELHHFLKNYFKKGKYNLYAGKSGLVKAEEADSCIGDIASANWHATASFVSQHVETGVMVDIGSTTTDVISFDSGKLTNNAYTDHERLRSNELVYSGIIRTPVMAVVNKIFCDGQWQNIAAENFSTMADVYRLTGELNENDDMMMTADGEGKSKIDSARRLLRMVALDLDDKNDLQHAIKIADQIANSQLNKLDESLLKVLSIPRENKISCLVGAGAGRFLIRKLASKNNLEYIDFTDLLSFSNEDETQIISCAAAVSVAQIARVGG